MLQCLALRGEEEAGLGRVQCINNLGVLGVPTASWLTFEPAELPTCITKECHNLAATVLLTKGL